MYNNLRNLRLFVPALILVAALLTAESASAQDAPPAAPTNLSAQLWSFYGVPGVTLTWTDNSSNEAGFVLEHWLFTKVKWVLQSSNTLTPDTDTWGGVGRVRTGKNRYRVKAFNAYGDSAWSNWADIFLHK